MDSLKGRHKENKIDEEVLHGGENTLLSGPVGRLQVHVRIIQLFVNEMNPPLAVGKGWRMIDQTSWVSVSSCVKGGSLCCWSSEGTSGSPREPLGWRNDIWVLSLSIPSLSQKPRLTVTGPEAPFSQGQVDCLLQGLQLYQGFKTSWREPEPGNQKYQEQWTWPHPGQLSDPSLRGHLIHRWRIQCQPGIRTFGRPLMGPLSMILCDIPAKEARAQETLAWQVLTVCSTKY